MRGTKRVSNVVPRVFTRQRSIVSGTLHVTALVLLIFAQTQQVYFAFTFNKNIRKLLHKISDDITSPCVLFSFVPQGFFPRVREFFGTSRKRK